MEGAPEGCDVWLRLAGPQAALDSMSREVLAGFRGECVEDSFGIWTALGEFNWAHPAGTLIKVPAALLSDGAPASGVGAVAQVFGCNLGPAAMWRGFPFRAAIGPQGIGEVLAGLSLELTVPG